MSNRVGLAVPGIPRPGAEVPELVEVVYQPAEQADLLRELARVRCEVDEALECLQEWEIKLLDRLLVMRSGPSAYIQSQLSNLRHVRAHLLTALDPHYRGPLH